VAQWRVAKTLPATVAGAATALGPGPHRIPYDLLAKDRQNQSYAAGAPTSNGEPTLTGDFEDAQRHRDKMQKRKAVQDAEVAGKTISQKGLLIVHTGPGKGKSTAAFGLALRALGRGWKIGVVQFGKGAWQSGERNILEKFDGVSWHTLGEGFTWETQDRARDEGAARRAWEKALSLMSDPAVRLLILDELNISLRYDHLPLEEVIAGLGARRSDLHIVVTGRNAKPELINIADLVTEMTLVKHHFAAGVKAQEGIEF
jgi:cob(I)alamin adenosyltransferase